MTSYDEMDEHLSFFKLSSLLPLYEGSSKSSWKFHIVKQLCMEFIFFYAKINSYCLLQHAWTGSSLSMKDTTSVWEEPLSGQHKFC